jgi:hypothetical protein
MTASANIEKKLKDKVPISVDVDGANVTFAAE